MTLEQLTQRLIELEHQVAELRGTANPLGPLPRIEETFGMFRDDPEFEEIVRLGREHRERAHLSA